MVWGILPVDQSISWESHLFGSVAGIFCAFYFRKKGPQRVKPQWEIDEETEANSTEENVALNLDPESWTDDNENRINYQFIDKNTDDNKSS